jgi:hypothetical protein
MFFLNRSRALRRLCNGILFLSILSLDCRVAGPLLAMLVSADTPARAAAEQPPPLLIVIGFVGGFVRHDNAGHQEVQLAARLRQHYPTGLEVRIFENHLGGEARREILRLLDIGHNGTLSGAERLKTHIVLYGHSWGASEVVAMARLLERDSIPVSLTIQVDSVSKPGQDDKLIPANVAQAINFYQLNGFLHGRRKIVAADPLRTEILGNVQLDYKSSPINCDGYPWYAQIFMKPHIEIESDPGVWDRIESLIRSKLLPAALLPAAATQGITKQFN